MNRFFITSSAAILSRSNFYNFNKTILQNTSISKFISTFRIRLRIQCYSSTTTVPVPRKKRSKKTVESTTMEEEKDAFYVVRKGDIVGVYKSLSDCQAQVGSTVCDPAVSVYKGYSFPKEADEYLSSRGLKNAIYTINAADAKEDLFGSLIPCLFQQPASSRDKPSNKPSPPKRSQEVLESTSNLDEIGSCFSTDASFRKQLKLDKSVKTQSKYLKCTACTLEFDGACKGNPGPSGAGAVLKAADGSVVWRIREGVGIATNNVAEYRAVLLGLKQALKKGFTEIRVKGDSKLVCMQVQGLWKCKNDKMANLCKEVMALVAQFSLFEISHVLRDFNSDADAEANLALNLKDGQVEEICEEKYT